MIEHNSANANARVAVITPTVGTEHLLDCIKSVAAQSYENLVHYIVVDGEEYAEKVRAQIAQCPDETRLTLMVLPHNTGAKGYYGHRIYGALPFLVDADYVCFLDEDNWFDANHIELLHRLVSENSLSWAYALRKVVSHTGEFICNDDCESLGIWGQWHSEQHHIDTSCYFLRRDLAIDASSVWNRKGYSSDSIDPDKALCQWLMSNEIRGFTSGAYTVNYRLGASPQSSSAKFFLDGNAFMARKFRYFPWVNTAIGAVNVARSYRRIYTNPAAAKAADGDSRGKLTNNLCSLQE